MLGARAERIGMCPCLEILRVRLESPGESTEVIVFAIAEPRELHRRERLYGRQIRSARPRPP